MPSRVIRDGLIDSEVVSNLHDRTFRLYLFLLLSADDYGLVAIDFGPIKRATPMLDWSREMVSKMLGELVDSGLILPYESAGKRYAAIARWKATVNSLKPKHPVPSFGMGHMLTPYRCKNKSVEAEVERILNNIKGNTTNSDTPVVLQRSAGDSLGSRQSPEGVRGKGVKETPSVSDLGFERFWAAYPRKDARAAATKAWRKAAPDAETQDILLAAVNRAAATEQWRKDGGQFVPHASTWLNGRRWEDQTPVSEITPRVAI